MKISPVVHYTISDVDLITEDRSLLTQMKNDQNKSYVLRVKDLPEDKKPREKMIKNGPTALTSKELLAAVLGTGTRKEEVLVMASRIFKEYGEKTLASEKNPKNLHKELSVPLGKACQIIACFELGRRFFSNKTNGQNAIRTTKQAFDYLQDMGKLPKEHLRGIYLNSHYRIIHDEIISVGSLTSNVVHPREVFRPAIECSAAAVLVAHNHPSGETKPTASDIAITQQLVKAGEIIGIELLDHLIIAENSCVSILNN